MIAFYRKIRQRLMNENKLSKYLLYAIGEILLVVIGILIALQINNWNENKKERFRSHTLLENLVEEIKQDSIYFNNVYEVEKNTFLKSAELLFDVHSNSNLGVRDEAEMGMAFRFACFTPVIKFSDNAYKELISSDLLKRIKSDKLKRDLHEYYSQINFLLLYSEQTHGITNDLIDQLANYYIVIPEKKSDDREISNFSGAGEGQFTTHYNLDSFRKNKSLNPKLYDMIDIHKDRLGGLKIIKTLGQRIQKEAKKEINNERRSE